LFGSYELIEMTHSLVLTLQPQPLAVSRLDPSEPIPACALLTPFLSITRTADELSIVCPARSGPAGVRSVGPWRALKVEGPLDFSLTGILAGLSAALSNANISLFAISTFDTDYMLVREETLDAAIQALRGAGYRV